MWVAFEYGSELGKTTRPGGPDAARRNTEIRRHAVVARRSAFGEVEPDEQLAASLPEPVDRLHQREQIGHLVGVGLAAKRRVVAVEVDDIDPPQLVPPPPGVAPCARSQPRCQAVGIGDCVETGDEPEEDRLGQIFCLVPVEALAPSDREHVALIPIDERLPGALIASTALGNQVGIAGPGSAHGLDVRAAEAKALGRTKALGRMYLAARMRTLDI